MLTIRPEQKAVFEEVSWRALADRARCHLRTYFSDECNALEEAALEARIDEGIRRARGHGMASESDILRYLNLSMVFGSDFDRDVRYPWAAEILELKDFSPQIRMEMLSERALQELDRVEMSQEGADGGEGQPEEFDGLPDHEESESIDGSTAEPIEWEPEDPEPVWDLEPEPADLVTEADPEDGW